MCCRYYYEDEIRERMQDLLDSQSIMADASLKAEPGRDVRPSDASAVIFRSGGGVLSAGGMRWGFSNPYRKGLIINARAETAAEKNLFADSVAKRRCIIPASGFYEWDTYKARFRFTLPDGGLILMAGFWHEEQGTPRYTILTTEANGSMKPVHDRMPVMIGRDEIGPWIYDDSKLSEFMGRMQPELICEQDSGQIRMDFEI
ncbi:MAG: SOS response-associated peptidase [Mogibacterium sp.]|nr:SOS response-associated peptidase [Mogibacterium sp.]